MTTRPRLTTTPEYKYIEVEDTSTLLGGVVVSNTLLTSTYANDDAILHGARGLAPKNPTVTNPAGNPIAVSIQAQSAVNTNAAEGGSVSLVTGTGTGGNKSGQVRIVDALGVAGWNKAHLVMGTYHLWVSATGKLYIKNGAPTTDTDGTVVGTQT